MPTPEQAAYVREFAFIPIGYSEAAAIVCCILYFGFAVAATASWIYTKFSWYDFLLFSALFRVVAMAVKAVYLSPGNYRPALQGVFLAFYNADSSVLPLNAFMLGGAFHVERATKYVKKLKIKQFYSAQGIAQSQKSNGLIISGYGGNVMAMSLVFGVSWLSKKEVDLYPRWFELFCKYFSLFLVACIATFGPILGSIAAFLEYGQYNHPSAALEGEKIRFAASYGLLSSNFSLAVMLSIWSMRCLLSTEVRRKAVGKKLWHRKEPRWIALLCFCCILAMVRGGVGIAALYPSTMDVWGPDRNFYTLDTFFEFIVLCILCYPTLYARMGCAWPKEASEFKPKPDEEANGS